MVAFTLLTPPGSELFRAALLNFDNEIRILADPSWDGINAEDVLFMEKTLSEIDLILLSQPTPEFIGGYTMLCIKFPHLMAAIPVYATVAVSQLGRVATVEFYRARGLLGPVLSALLEVSDVDEWFDRITLVKYFQNMTMLENRLLLTAYNSGYSLGGAFWLITKRLQKVVYAPSWNHSKDSFLNGAGFTSGSGSTPAQLIRPTAVITSTHLGSALLHKKRTEKFLGLVDATLANGGAVLLPISISGRFFELLQIVDTHLSNLQGAAIPVYFLSYSGTKVLSYASNLLDWMSTLLIKEYAGQSTGDQAYSRTPFNPSKVDLLLDPNELVQLPGPKIVFASGLEFRSGDLSSKTLDYICRDEKTTIILTEKTACNTDNNIASDLYNEWFKLALAKNNGQPEDGIPVPLEKAFSLDGWSIEEPLLADELKDFTDRVNQTRRQKLMEKVRDKKNKNILEAEEDSSSSSEDDLSDDEQLISSTIEAGALPTSTTITASSTNAAINTLDMFVTDYVTENINENKPVDFKVSSKMRPKQAMFPFSDLSKKRKFDDYGEVIDVNLFRHTDEEAANSKIINDSRRKFDDERGGKWGEDSRSGRRFDKQKQSAKDKLTPQEALNNELLKKYLDTLHQPAKRVSIPTEAKASIRVRCGLSFVDLAGLADLRSLSTILSSLRPRNLVLLPDITYTGSLDPSLNGRKLVQAAFQKQIKEQKLEPGEDSESFNSHFDLLLHARSIASTGPTNELKVFLPEDNEPIQVGGDVMGRNTEFEVQLNEELSNALNWQKLEGHYKITHVRGELGIYEPSKKVKDSEEYSKEAASTLPQLLLKPIVGPISTADPLSGTAPEQQKLANFGSTLAIGNVRLTELRKKLLALNMNAEFKGEGVLVVNNEVSIQKLATDNTQSDDAGDIMVDGQIGPLYYQVKKCIREMLAFV